MYFFIFLAFGFAPQSNFDQDGDDDRGYTDGKSLSDDDISEFGDTVTGISEVDVATSGITNFGYNDQDANIMTGNKSHVFWARKGGRNKSSLTSISRNTTSKKITQSTSVLHSFLNTFLILGGILVQTTRFRFLPD